MHPTYIRWSAASSLHDQTFFFLISLCLILTVCFIVAIRRLTLQRGTVLAADDIVAEMKLAHTDHTRRYHRRIDLFSIIMANFSNREATLHDIASALRHSLDANQRKLDARQSDLEACRRDLDSRRRELGICQTDLEHARVKNAGLDARLCAEATKIESLELKLGSAYDRLASTVTERDFLQIDLEHCREDLQIQRQRALDKSYALEDAFKATMALERENAFVTEERDRLRQQSIVWKDAHDKLAHVLRECDAEDYLTVILTCLRQETELQELRGIKDDVGRDRRLLVTKTEEASGLFLKQVTYESDLAELRMQVRKFQGEKERIESDHIRLQDLLKIAHDNAEASKLRFDSSLAKWHERVLNLEKVLHEMRRHADDLAVQVDTLSEKNAELSCTVQYLKRELDVQQGTIRSRDDIIQAAQTRADLELEERREELNRLEEGRQLDSQLVKQLQAQLEKRDDETTALQISTRSLPCVDWSPSAIVLPVTPSARRKHRSSFPLTPPSTPPSPLFNAKFLPDKVEDLPDLLVRPGTPTPNPLAPVYQSCRRSPRPYRAPAGFPTSPPPSPLDERHPPKTPVRRPLQRSVSLPLTPTSLRKSQKKPRGPSGPGGKRLPTQRNGSYGLSAPRAATPVQA